jgi:hypothetical protein
MENFAGVVGSLATNRRGSGGEVIGRYAAVLFGSLILRKPGNIGGYLQLDDAARQSILLV